MTTVRTSARLLPIYAWSALWSKTEKEHRKNSHLILHFPMSEGVSEVSEGVSKVSEQTSECSGACEQSEHGGASRWVNGASDRANGRASVPVLTSGFLVILDHSYRRRSKQRQPFNFHGVFCTFYYIFNSNEIPVVYPGALGLVKQCWDIWKFHLRLIDGCT